MFKISTDGVLTNLYSFTGTNDGECPGAGLVQGSDGYFYGTTVNGGTSETLHDLGDGTVFKITADGVLTSLYSFTNGTAYPRAGLVQDGDGCFYGTTAGANMGFGFKGNGTVFKINTNGMLTNLYSFTGTNDGMFPAGLVPGNDGYFYSTTFSGGAFKDYFGHGCGTVFKISTNGVFTSMYSFTGTNDGEYPQGGLVLGSDGFFYGVTDGNSRGPNYGTVFKISTNGVLTVLHSFGSVRAANGNPLGGDGPSPGLVLGSDGSFYGTTLSGGANNQGTVFRITVEPQLTITPSGTNDILSWPADAAGYTLEFTTNLAWPMAWNADLMTGRFIIDGQNVVTNPNTGAKLSYRLARGQMFGTSGQAWVALEHAMAAAGAINYGHQAVTINGSTPPGAYDMFYLPVPAGVIELANANPKLCQFGISASAGSDRPGYGCANQWEGMGGSQLINSPVIFIVPSVTANSCAVVRVYDPPL